MGGVSISTRTRTAPLYRLYALPDGERPGLVRVEKDGAAIECEVWEMPLERFGSFVSGIAGPLGIGHVTLEDGREVCGFICEATGVRDALDITRYGGWRAWLGAKAA
ncbi:allophanate hydrolase-related protein [Pelomicrobium methylotrophicum]|uniref:allophanate hydrolase-related protein n=1 Tax=Pelomicrobium methylotrophicum TaxID=2602750 RepID=UPI001969A53F